MKKLLMTVLVLGLAAGSAWQASAGQAAKPAAKPDMAKVAGFWELEVNADGEIIYLTMTLAVVEGKLTGKTSEQNGMFTDAPLGDIVLEGDLLKCTATVPSPPDGATRPWAIELKIGADTADGSIGNAELMISASLTGRRTKK